MDQRTSENAIFDVGSSVMTATSMSESLVAGPLLGAAPARLQAGRLSYMRPRVPSMGSRMMRMGAASSLVPSGNVRPVSGSIPSATITIGIVLDHSSQNRSI